MSNQTSFTQSRRNFLKGTAAISALSIGGLSSVALASTGTSAIDPIAVAVSKIFSETGIKIIQETLLDREKVTLINQSGKLQMLDARQPISLYQTNDALVVTVNQDDAKAVNGMILMSPDQQWTFDVKAVGIEVSDVAANKLQISSAYSVFNRTVPVQIV